MSRFPTVNTPPFKPPACLDHARMRSAHARAHTRSHLCRRRTVGALSAFEECVESVEECDGSAQECGLRLLEEDHNTRGTMCGIKSGRACQCG